MDDLLFSFAPVFGETNAVSPLDRYDDLPHLDPGQLVQLDRVGLGRISHGWVAAADMPDSPAGGAAVGAPVSNSGPIVSAPLQSWGATVTAIIDGDTFEVTWDAGYEPPAGLLDRIRIAGVDTNETTFNESFSQEAKARLAQLIPVGTHVRLEAQDENSQTLNRPVRHVFNAANVNVAEVLISEGLGLAVSYDFEPDYRADYFTASENAQVGEVGMWEPGASGGNPATWPSIQMVVNYDAGGDDALNLNDEYIQIRNNGPASLDLSNWSARSSARLDAATIKIPFGAVIDAGETYRIYVGAGLNTANSMHLGLSEPLFDNTGDVVYLRDVDLNVRATQLWPATITRGPEQSIVIDDVQYDAPGDDNTNPNGEWVKIRNAGAVTIDLTDWRLKDDGFDYAFKPGQTLAPGAKLTIFVGSGTDSGANLYWGNSTGILNNDGQKLHVWTPQSLEVDTYAWGSETSLNEDPRGAIRMFANFDAAGNDATNPNGEWVSLWNTSGSAINIGGYKLVSGPDTYTFAGGTTLAADANLLVKVGTGTNTTATKFWGKSAGIFANAGDQVDLVDTTGETLLRHKWPATGAVTNYGLVIDAVNYDAPGSDATNPNGEWIRIHNASLAEQNLRNWQIQVGSSQLNSLADRPMAPGETITVFMGTGTNTADTIYWGKSAGILANDGSTPVQLLSPSREQVQYHAWGSAASSSKQSVPAAIDMSINYDAAGDDAANPKGEWVNLHNTSSSTVSLNGYHLYTDGTTYAFDSGDTLAPGERMRVYRGTGTDAGLVRYSNLNEFSNTGDEVELRLNGSGVADVFAYPVSGLVPTRGSFEVSNVNFDAVGDDNTNPNGEWIQIKNTGSSSADLRDWRIQYQTATFYDFNNSVVVPGGGSVKLYIGSGTNTATDLYWGNASGILSNSAGTVALQSKYRETADTFVWPGTAGAPASIVIDDVQYDAPGDDNTNPNGEWVKIRNAGATTVNLEGWLIKDEVEDYRFGAGESLAPGQMLTVYIGSGTDSGTDRYWGNSTGILNNAGQQLHVWTAGLVPVDTYAYGTAISTGEDPRGAIRMFANFDAAGDDATNPNGEWVSLWNSSGSTLDIGGYKLVSGTDVYTFATGTTIAADANLLVKVGSGTNTVTTKFWGKTSGIFANAGDYVDLVNTTGDTLLRHAWPAPYTGVTNYGLVIDAVNYDAPGNDSTNPNGEWIQIRNSSSAEQNLLNWQIQVGSEQLNLLSDRPIAPGETVTVFMGTGTNTSDTVYWGKTAGILTDSGATVKLLAPSREVIQHHGWGTAPAVANQSVPAAIDMSINYDAVGDDAANPRGEWVNLVNTSSSTVSLNGFHLYTDGTTYAFDQNDVLAAGERLRVYRGTGTDAGLVRYSNLNEFANSGDEIELRPNGSGGLADVFAYPATGLLPARGNFEIVAVNVDAAGDDATNPNGEWIDIKNVGTSAADLRDWRLQYQTATFFDFNNSAVVAAGSTIRLFIGSGTNTASSLYWGNASGILSNTTGTLALQSLYRETADTYSWP